MNLKVFALVTAVALLVGGFTMSNLAQLAKATNNDKCLTSQLKDRTETARICNTGDPEWEGLVKDFKKSCKDNTDNKEVRCSSSQTGNGVFGNEKNKP